MLRRWPERVNAIAEVFETNPKPYGWTKADEGMKSVCIFIDGDACRQSTGRTEGDEVATMYLLDRPAKLQGGAITNETIKLGYKHSSVRGPFGSERFDDLGHADSYFAAIKSGSSLEFGRFAA